MKNKRSPIKGVLVSEFPLLLKVTKYYGTFRSLFLYNINPCYFIFDIYNKCSVPKSCSYIKNKNTDKTLNLSSLFCASERKDIETRYFCQTIFQYTLL